MTYFCRHNLPRDECPDCRPPPDLFDEPVKDGYEAPPLSHSDGPDTEREAADKGTAGGGEATDPRS